MIDLFMPFQAFFKFENVCTDNNVFRMHYKFTVIMLLVFTLLVTSKQFFGEPIHCIGDSDKSIDAINSYCWIYGTYTLKSRLEGEDGKHRAYPGVGPAVVDDEEKRHTYYQWVCFVFIGQAALFYTPRYLWKIWEGGRLKTLAADLASPIVPKDWSEYRRDELIAYLGHTNIYSHNLYALRYAFCELLNLVNVIGQIFLLDIFLGGSFRNYGTAVAVFNHKQHFNATVMKYVHPMDEYFPKLTKCFMRLYGPSGGLQHLDWVCVLPLNIVNEKIFVIIWFWFIFLALLSATAVFFRVMVFSLAPLRTLMIMGQLRFVKRRIVSSIVRRFNFGDWFILYLLGKNMNPRMYKDLILELSKELEHKTVQI